MALVKQICVRTSEELHRRITCAAHDERMSTNQWIIQAVLRELGELPPKGLAPGIGNEEVA